MSPDLQSRIQTWSGIWTASSESRLLSLDLECWSPYSGLGISSPYLGGQIWCLESYCSDRESGHESGLRSLGFES